MSSASNETIGDPPGVEEKIFWTVFHILVALSSLIGDSVILVGTIRYKAIKLHRVIVVTIQHLAVCDLLLTVFRLVPLAVSLIGEGWVLGSFLCRVNLILPYIVTPCSAMLTCVLSTFKLLIVQRPLRRAGWSKKRAHIVCGASWMLCLLLPSQFLNLFFTPEESLYFDYNHYICHSDFDLTSAPLWLIDFAHISIIFGVVGLLFILITTSAILLYKARKAVINLGGTVRWQGVLTVTLTTGVFLVSYLPDTIVPLIVRFTSLSVSSSIQRTASFFENTNIVANFFIYAVTVRSFRDFLSTKIRQLAAKIGLSSPNRPGLQERPHLGAQRAMQSSRTVTRESAM